MEYQIYFGQRAIDTVKCSNSNAIHTQRDSLLLNMKASVYVIYSSSRLFSFPSDGDCQRPLDLVCNVSCCSPVLVPDGGWVRWEEDTCDTSIIHLSILVNIYFNAGHMTHCQSDAVTQWYFKQPNAMPCTKKKLN